MSTPGHQGRGHIGTCLVPAAWRCSSLASVILASSRCRREGWRPPRYDWPGPPTGALGGEQGVRGRRTDPRQSVLCEVAVWSVGGSEE